MNATKFGIPIKKLCRERKHAMTIQRRIKSFQACKSDYFQNKSQRLPTGCYLDKGNNKFLTETCQG